MVKCVESGRIGYDIGGTHTGSINILVIRWAAAHVLTRNARRSAAIWLLPHRTRKTTYRSAVIRGHL